MKIKADEYYNDGIFEMARFGKHNVMKNLMKPKQHQKYLNILKSKYVDLKKEIDELISDIHDEVTQCNPVQLLSFSADMVLMTLLGIESEIQVSNEDVRTARMTEYIQSVLVSSPNYYVDNAEIVDPREKFFSIQNKIDRLYELINQFYMSWGICLQDEHPEWGKDLIGDIVEAQMLYLVRGQRYQVFEVEYFEKLIFIHDDIFQSLFNISSTDVVEGIKKLQHSLSQGKLDSINKMGNILDLFSQDENVSEEEMFDYYQKDGALFYNEFFGTKLREVLEITGWKEKFVKELSYGLNEEEKFWQKAEFAGWPVIDLPVQKRPFIKLNDKYYCFDYYTFLDNFYRAMQKTVSRLAPDYSWALKQQEASEAMVETIFKQLLPGCLTYQGNYYPENGSIKQLAENDLLILYSNVLIIVEVKAGSFVYTPPLTDFVAHIKSYKSLIEKADWQCKRTYDYLTSADLAIVYDEKKKPKAKIDMSAITDIYMMSVTVDNINDFAAKAEKLNFLQLRCNAISISVDDLMVYREYFKSPLCFLHFLKQRQLATQEAKIALNDELDHLGLYIAHNRYTFQVDSIPPKTHVQFYGYRESLDSYFGKLYHPTLRPQKPVQNIPDLFIDIISYLDNTDLINKVEISNYILDFSTDAKEELRNQIEFVLKRQEKTKFMGAINASGTGESLRYTCFVNQPAINLQSDEEKENYVLATLLWNQDSDRVLLDLYFDQEKVFYKLGYKRFTPIDVPIERTEELKKQGAELAESRLERYKSINKNQKIGRNQLCPCGSGKKYKKCCGC